MSHFSVYVIAKDENKLEELLAPYSENIEVEAYVEETRSEVIESAKEMQKKYLADKERYEYYKVFENCKSDEEFLEACKNYYDDERFDEEGNKLSTYNPNSKWDWWSLGGRWSGGLTTKDGEDVSVCKVSELDIMPDNNKYNHAIRFWEVFVEGDSLRPGENADDFGSFWNKEYYTETYGDKEKYARACSSFAPYALVSEDGVWHQKGDMGWWGCSSNEMDSDKWIEECANVMTSANPDSCVYLVDCHI